MKKNILVMSFLIASTVTTAYADHRPSTPCEKAIAKAALREFVATFPNTTARPSVSDIEIILASNPERRNDVASITMAEGEDENVENTAIVVQFENRNDPEHSSCEFESIRWAHSDN